MATQTFEELIAGANKIKDNELPESNTHYLVGDQLLQMTNKMQEENSNNGKKFSELENKTNSFCFVLEGEKILDIDFTSNKITIKGPNVVINYGLSNKYHSFQDINTEDITIPRLNGLFVIGFDIAEKKFVFCRYQELPNNSIHTIAVGYGNNTDASIFFSTSNLTVNGNILKPIFDSSDLQKLQQELQKSILTWHVSVYKDDRKQKALNYAPNLFNKDISMVEGTMQYMYIPIKPNTEYITNTSYKKATVYNKNLSIVQEITWEDATFTSPNFEGEAYIKIYVPSIYADIMIFNEGGNLSNIKSYYGDNSKDNSILVIDESLKELILGCRVTGLYDDTLAIGYVVKTSRNTLQIYLNNLPDINNPSEYGALEYLDIPLEGREGVQSVEGKLFSVLIDFDYLNTLGEGVISNNLKGNYINKDLTSKTPYLDIIKGGRIVKISGYCIQHNTGFLYRGNSEILLIEIDNVADKTNTLAQIVWNNLEFGDNPATEYKYYAFFSNINFDNSGFISSKVIPNTSPSGAILNTEIPEGTKYFALTTSFDVKSPNATLTDITKPYLNIEVLKSIDGAEVAHNNYVNNPPNGVNLLDVSNYHPVQVWWGGDLIRHNTNTKSSILYIDPTRGSIVISGFKTNSKSDWRIWRIFSYDGKEVSKGYVSYNSDLVTEGEEITIPPVVIPLPTSAFVMIITTNAGTNYDLSTAKIEYGNEATEYSAYKEYPQIFAYNTINTKNTTFANIHWDVFGDSKTAEYYDGVRNWSYYVQEKLGIGRRNNYATSGAHWEDFETSAPRQKFSQQVIDAITHNDANNLVPDIITFSLGTNSLYTSVGDFDTIMAIDWGEDGSLIDRTTVFGGMRWGIETLKRKYPNAIFLASTPLPRSGSADDKIPDMINNMKKMLNEYGIPLIDLYQNGQYAPIIDKTIINSNPKTEGNWWHYDGLHDSNNGAQVTAKVWGSVIYPYLVMM